MHNGQLVEAVVPVATSKVEVIDNSRSAFPNIMDKSNAAFVMPMHGVEAKSAEQTLTVVARNAEENPVAAAESYSTGKAVERPMVPLHRAKVGSKRGKDEIFSVSSLPVGPRNRTAVLEQNKDKVISITQQSSKVVVPEEKKDEVVWAKSSGVSLLSATFEESDDRGQQDAISALNLVKIFGLSSSKAPKKTG